LSLFKLVRATTDRLIIDAIIRIMENKVGDADFSQELKLRSNYLKSIEEQNQ